MRHWEIEELLCRASGMSSEEHETFVNENNDVDNLVYETFGLDFEQFSTVVEALLKFTPLVESPLTGKVRHAFVDVAEQRTIICSEVNKI